MINNIVVFTNTLEKGGAEMQSVELSTVLSERYNVWLIVFYGDQIDSELLNRIDLDKITLVKLSGNKIKCVFEFINQIRRNNIDCAFSFLATTNFYAGILGRLCKVKYIIGGIRSSSYRGIKFYVQKFLHNYIMTLTVSNNHHAVKLLSEKGFKKSKFEVVHNVFPAPLVDSIRVINTDKLSIISVGRFVHAKDYVTSLRSIALLRDKCPTVEFKYIIIGYGTLENQIRSLVSDLALNDIVEIKINPKDIHNHLVNSDIYLSTSLFEGTSNSILEAMYANLPIVATNVGDNSYMVEDKNGFLVKIKDIEDISDKLKMLLLDSELRCKMGKASKEIVSSRFSLEVFALNNFNILENSENGAK